MDTVVSLVFLLLATLLGGCTLVVFSYAAVPRHDDSPSNDDVNQEAGYGRRRQGDRAGPPVAWRKVLAVPLATTLLGLFLMTLYVLPVAPA